MPYKDREKYLESQRSYYYKNPTRYKERVMQNKYGIGYEEYNKLAEQQGFSCKLCDRHVTDLGKNLYIDHDHDTGKVRGLLCNGCNAGLGMLGDNVEGLEKAIKYVKGEL